MKGKRLLSALVSLAIGIGCAAGLSVSVSAAGTTLQTNTYYTVNAFMDKGLVSASGQTQTITKSAYDELGDGKIFGDLSATEAGGTYTYQESCLANGKIDGSANISLNVEVPETGDCIVYLHAREYNSRAFKVTLDGGESHVTNTKGGEAQATDNKISGQAMIGSAGSVNIAAHYVKFEEVSKGTHTINLQYSGEAGKSVQYFYGMNVYQAAKTPGIHLSKKSYIMDSALLKELNLTAEVQNSSDTTVQWSSSDSSVASVDNGIVTANKKGTAIITAKNSQAEATCNITVVDSTRPEVAEMTNLPVSSSNVLNVGTGKQYTSIRAAVAAAKAINPKSEAERVVINVDPGTYREQVIITAPYVTIRKTPGTSGDVLMTWYYGTNTTYYSSKNGVYDEQAAQQTDKREGVKNWGATLQVEADHFVLENIQLENSFNQYYTQEELKDGCVNETNFPLNRGDAIQRLIAAGKSDNYINQWLKSRTDLKNCPELADVYSGSSFRERAAALYVTGDRAQFRGCTIYSTQDTIGLNYNRSYFENCLLEGTVDYICGGGQSVINNCILRAGSGPSLDPAQADGDGAHIAVPSTSLEKKGFLLYNCEITGTEWAGQNNLGRPWYPDGQAVFVNTKINHSTRIGYTDKLLISDEAWGAMSGNQPDKARLTEYNTVDSEGNPVDTSKRKALLLNEWTALEYNPYNYTKGSDGWDPAGLEREYQAIEAAVSAMTFTDPGTGFTIPMPTLNGYSLFWETEHSDFATVTDQNTLSVARPAYGEQDVVSSVRLYAKNNTSGKGIKVSVPVSIKAMASLENCGTVNGRLILNKAFDTDQVFKVQFASNGAVFKTANLTVPAGRRVYAYNIIGIPAGTYDVSVTPQNDGMGAIAEQKSLTIAADEAIDFNINGGNTTEVTIPAADPDTTTACNITDLTANMTPAQKMQFASADKIKVEYSVFVKQSDFNQGQGYANIDLIGGDAAQTCEDKVDATRYIRTRIYDGWHQLDMIDGSMTNFEGVNNITDRQILNVGGKYENIAEGVTYHIALTIDYKNGKITENTTGTSSTTYEFKPLPTGVDREKLQLACYHGDKTNYTVSDVSVTYGSIELGTYEPSAAQTELHKTESNQTGVYEGSDGSKATLFKTTVQPHDDVVTGVKWQVGNKAFSTEGAYKEGGNPFENISGGLSVEFFWIGNTDLSQEQITTQTIQ